MACLTCIWRLKIALISPTKKGDDVSVRQSISKLSSYKLGPTSSPKYAGITLTDLTASRLVYSTADKALASVANLASWVAGTANQITVTDDSDGTITLSIPAAAYIATSLDLGHATDTTITRSAAGTIAVQGVDVAMVGAAPSAHTHNGDTLQLDGVNSDGGAFAFNTTGTVTFNQTIAGALTGNVTGDCTGSSGSCTGNSATVTNATLTTALTVNTGTLTLTANVANTSVLTIGAGASSISGANTGDQTTMAGISDSKADFNTACSDGTFIFTGDAPTSHASSHAVSGADTVFPADPGSDKFLMWDDDPGALVWADAAAGNVTKVGNPADSQIGVWTGDGTIEGAATLTYDGSNLQLTGDIGSTGTRITKGWFTDLQVTNAIAGAVTGNAGTVTNATFTTALTVNTGTLTLTANVANNSVLTIGAGAVSVSGANTGDQTTLSGISDTKANFSTACSDGTFLFTGDAPTSHASSHAVSGGDTIFPADPGADRYLIWDDDPGQLAWAECSGGVAAHVMLDGSVHTDSVADGVTRGSLIYGNSTPKWDELVVATGFLRGVAAGDCGWLSYSDTMAALSATAGSAFSFNSQNLTSVGTISSGHIGVGVGATSSISIYSVDTYTDTDNSSRTSIYFTLDSQKTSAAYTNVSRSFWGVARVGASNTQNWTAELGLRCIEAEVQTVASSTGTITGMTCFYGKGTIVNAATVTNYYGMYLANPSVTNSKLTNNYGLYIPNQSGGATLNYAIYTNDGAVRIGGDLQVPIGTVSATAFSGPLTGNVTGDCTGSSGSCTGLAATATALATARTIGGVSFDGTAAITVASATGGFAVTGGNLTLDTNDIAVNTDKFTVDGATGNTLVAGTFESTGIATLADASVTKTTAAPGADAQIANKKYVDDEDAKIGFVDRGDPTSVDWDESSSGTGNDHLTEDGTWNDLDCSSIVPAGAVAISFFLSIQDDTASSLIMMRKNGNSNTFAIKQMRTQVANVRNPGEMTIACDSNRVVEYLASNTAWSDIDITITGWWLNA